MEDLMTNKAAGKFLQKDKKGYLVNDAAVDEIASEFKPLITNVKQIIIETLNESLHSIYLTGSIPRGMAQIGKSDLDLYAILNPNCTDESLSKIKQKCDALLNDDNVVSKIDIELWRFENISSPSSGIEKISVKNTLSTFDIILKIASICIYGEDLSRHIPPIKPGIALANDELIVIHEDINQAKESILNAEDSQEIKYWCKRVMKNIIRAGFCLCIPIIHEQTRDIDLCSEVFSRYYPDMEDISKQAVTWIENPLSNPQDIIEFLNNEGTLFLAKVDRWMQKYNPVRKQELIVE